jgi:hypothetical protein
MAHGPWPTAHGLGVLDGARQHLQQRQEPASGAFALDRKGRGPCTWSRMLSSAGASRAWLAAGLRLALRAPARSAAGGRSPRCVLEGKTSCTVRRHHVWGAGVAGRPSRLPPETALSRTARQARPCADTGGCRQMQPDGRGWTRMRLGPAWRFSAAIALPHPGSRAHAAAPMRGFCVHLHTTDPAQPTGHRPSQTSRSGRHGCTPGHKR